MIFIKIIQTMKLPALWFSKSGSYSLSIKDLCSFCHFSLTLKALKMADHFFPNFQRPTKTMRILRKWTITKKKKKERKRKGMIREDPEPSLPSFLKIWVRVARNVGAIFPSTACTCIRDLQTSAGKMATHRDTPPTPPHITVLKAPERLAFM